LEEAKANVPEAMLCHRIHQITNYGLSTVDISKKAQLAFMINCCNIEFPSSKLKGHARWIEGVPLA
jgi:hypothetical protein